MTAEKSLHLLVEKWLMPISNALVRVTRFSRSRLNGTRFVCVEVQRPDDSIALFFFRHNDGTWRVYPPEPQRLTISLTRVSADPGTSSQISDECQR
jgi:hypothetical protein